MRTGEKQKKLLCGYKAYCGQAALNGMFFSSRYVNFFDPDMQSAENETLRLEGRERRGKVADTGLGM